VSRGNDRSSVFMLCDPWRLELAFDVPQFVVHRNVGFPPKHGRTVVSKIQPIKIKTDLKGRMTYQGSLARTIEQVLSFDTNKRDQSHDYPNPVFLSEDVSFYPETPCSCGFHFASFRDRHTNSTRRFAEGIIPATSCWSLYITIDCV
jgi:hypothetical protein